MYLGLGVEGWSLELQASFQPASKRQQCGEWALGFHAPQSPGLDVWRVLRVQGLALTCQYAHTLSL